MKRIKRRKKRNSGRRTHRRSRRNPNIGVPIARRLFYKLAGKCNLSARELEDIIYGDLNQLASEATIGDWIELPNGTTYTLTFKPGA